MPNAASAPARRIVSLLPSATEIVCALGLSDRLVGVTHECDFPPEARGKPVLTASALPAVGASAAIDRHVRRSLHGGSSLYTLDAELLEQLEPDLILTQELCEVCAVSYAIVARAARRLSSDPRVVSLEPSSLEDVYGTIQAVAELAGVSERAATLIATLREREAKLAGHVAGRARPRALVLEWTDPPMSGGHWTPDLLALAGGEPLLTNRGANSRVLGWDEIEAADPDVVLVAPCGFDLTRALAAIDEIGPVTQWRGLRALRDERVYAIDGNAYVNRPGPRLIDTAEIFASALFGERYGAAALENLQRL